MSACAPRNAQKHERRASADEQITNRYSTLTIYGTIRKDNELRKYFILLCETEGVLPVL